MSAVAVRAGFFFGAFILVACWEAAARRRKPAFSRGRRWPSNLAIVLLNSLSVYWLLPISALGMAEVAEIHGWGLLRHLDVPYWPALVLTVALMDFAVYLQHVMFHSIPILWRLHRVHHADMDYDVTTGLRFHPIEIFLSMLIKMAVIAVLGPPMMGVLAFEILLNATAMFNHGNIAMPGGLDRILRLFVVTPDMHRVHHSIAVSETNSNFGFNLPWWDRLCGTYKSQPAAGHEGMTIGITQFRDPRSRSLPWMLALPFVEDVGPYPINRFEATP